MKENQILYHAERPIKVRPVNIIDLIRFEADNIIMFTTFTTSDILTALLFSEPVDLFRVFISDELSNTWGSQHNDESLFLQSGYDRISGEPSQYEGVINIQTELKQHVNLRGSVIGDMQSLRADIGYVEVTDLETGDVLFQVTHIGQPSKRTAFNFSLGFSNGSYRCITQTTSENCFARAAIEY